MRLALVGSLRIQKRDLKFQLPRRGRKIVRTLGISIGLDADVYWLKSQTHDPADTAADWDQPDVAARSIPVGRDDRRECDVIAFPEVIVDEVLQGEGINVSSARWTCNRKQVAYQHTQRSLPRLNQSDR
jgi:hypothetical protein